MCRKREQKKKTCFQNYMRYIVGAEFLISVTRGSTRKTTLTTEQDLNVKRNYLCVGRQSKKKKCFQNYMRYIVGAEFLISITRSNTRKTTLTTEQDLNVKANYLCVERQNRKKTTFQN